MSWIYKCGHCKHVGVRAGNGYAHWCALCQLNNQLTFVEDTEVTRRTVNGNIHLANMEVREYDGIKIVTETLFDQKAVRVTIYCGDNPAPISKEAYGNVSSDLDKHTEGELSSSSL